MLAVLALPVAQPAADADRAAAGTSPLRVKLPLHRAGGGVERPHLEHGRHQVERAVDDDRRGLDGGLRPFAGIAAGVAPGHLEVLDVGLVDLLERGVAAGAGVASIVLPLPVRALAPGLGGAGRGRRGRGGGQGREKRSTIDGDGHNSEPALGKDDGATAYRYRFEQESVKAVAGGRPWSGDIRRSSRPRRAQRASRLIPPPAKRTGPETAPPEHASARGPSRPVRAGSSARRRPESRSPAHWRSST